MHLQQREYIDVKQAERDYPFSERTFWKFISEGRLTAYRPLRRKVLVRRSEIERLIEKSRIGA